MRKLSLSICLAAAAVLTAHAADLAGPVTGIVFDQKARALRPMLGVPGASYLGAALLSNLDAAALSPDGAAALAVADGALVAVSGLRSGQPTVTPLDGGIAQADLLVWSNDGSYAAAYSSVSRQAQLVRDASRNPAAGASIDTGLAVIALAIGDSGDLVAGAEGGVYLLANGAAPRLLAAASRVAALAIRRDTLFAADIAAGQVLAIEHFAGSPAPAVFASGIDSPVGLQVSASGQRLFVASRAGKSVTALDVESHAAAARVELDFSPSELRSFGAQDVWLLNSNDASPLPLYVVTGANEPAAWFVPAGREQ